MIQNPQADIDALRQHASSAAEVAERVSALKSLGAAKPADPDIKRFLRQRAAGDRDRAAAFAAMEALLHHDAEDADTMRLAKSWALAEEEIKVRPRLVASDDRADRDEPRPSATAAGERYDWLALRADTIAALFKSCRLSKDAMSFVAERASDDPDPAIRRHLLELLAEAGDRSPTLLHFVISRALDDPDPTCRAAAYAQLAKHCGKKLEVRDFLRQRAEQDLEHPAQHHCVIALIEASGHEAETWRIIRRIATSTPNLETQRLVFKAAAENNARTQDTRDLIYHVALRSTDTQMRLDAIEAVVRNCRTDPKVWPLLERLIEQEKDNEIGVAAKKAVTRLRR